MDKNPLNFDMLGEKTVYTKVVKTVLVKDTGYEKNKIYSCAFMYG